MTGTAEAAAPEEEAVCSCGLSRPHNPLTSRAIMPACHAGVAGNVHDRGRGWGESVGNGGPFKWWKKVLPGSGESVSWEEAADDRKAHFPAGSQTRWTCQSYLVIFHPSSALGKELGEGWRESEACLVARLE